MGTIPSLSQETTCAHKNEQGRVFPLDPSCSLKKTNFKESQNSLTFIHTI